MNKATKQLLKENNRFEESLHENTQLLLTDLICYLRGSDLSEYNQELVRRDIITMLYDGEQRGQSSNEIIGDDYKTFCDEIIGTFPKKTSFEKIIDLIQIFLTTIPILFVIHIVEQIITCIHKGQLWYNIDFTAGNLLSALYLSILSVGIVQYVCKTSFSSTSTMATPKNYRYFIKIWIILCCLLAISICLNFFFDSILFQTNIIFCLLFLVLCGLGHKLCDYILP